MNMPTETIQNIIEQLYSYIETSKDYVEVFWLNTPLWSHILFVLVLMVAGINIITSLVKAIIINRASWKKKPDSELMYSFAAGSGQFQRSRVFKDAHILLFDKKWSVISFAGIAYRIGNYENLSKALLFLISLIYLPFAVMGTAEMVIRYTVGAVFYFVINLLYLLVLLSIWVINCLVMPLFMVIDKCSSIKQHCPKCYATFNLPVFECSHCGTKHSNLRPGRCGLVFAKCSCGHFLPCSSISKRKELKSYCPKCDTALAGSNIKALTIQLIGGNSSGKTAFVSAFQHKYIEGIKNTSQWNVTTSPKEEFDKLEKMYQSGKTEMSSDNEVRAYYILHGKKGSSDDGIVIYDVPDEVILSEQYDRNPLNFAYCDGLIIIIDPLSVSSVRKECEKTLGSESISGFSADSTEDIIIHYINKYSEVAGRTARKMSNTPVAVLITKTDLTPIRRKIGLVKIKAAFSLDKAQYSNLEDARNKICRRYLSDIGLQNAINNLDSVFNSVSYFPISSIGHYADDSPFEPQNVIAPIRWLAQYCNSGLAEAAKNAEEQTE